VKVVDFGQENSRGISVRVPRLLARLRLAAVAHHVRLHIAGGVIGKKK
jgi:hypothetical protein